MNLPINEIYDYWAYYLSKKEEYIDKLRLKGKLAPKEEDLKAKMNDFERKLNIMGRQK